MSGGGLVSYVVLSHGELFKSCEAVVKKRWRLLIMMMNRGDILSSVVGKKLALGKPGYVTSRIGRPNRHT